MAISQNKSAKYKNAFEAVAENDLRELMKLVSSMTTMKYSEKCPLEDSQYFQCSLLHAAAVQGNPEIVTYLINKGFSVMLKNDAGQTPMHYAIAMRKKNVCDILQIMLGSDGANINARDSDGDSLLHYAVCRDLKIVEFLIKNKARVGTANCWGETPLHTAAEKADLPVMKYLLMHKADIEAKDKYGCTPLRSALNGRDPETAVAFLLDAGASPTDPDNDGNTTLHIAAMTGETSSAKRLVKAGADRSLRNSEGKTAADLCRNEDITERLCPKKRQAAAHPGGPARQAPVKAHDIHQARKEYVPEKLRRRKTAVMAADR